MGSVDTETEIKCPKCKKMINRDRAAKNKYVCYECGYYFRVKTHNRIRMVADRKSFQPWFEEIEESNPLKYEGYEEKLSEAREKSGVKEAVTVGECEIYGEKAVIGICESKFMMGRWSARKSPGQLKRRQNCGCLYFCSAVPAVRECRRESCH